MQKSLIELYLARVSEGDTSFLERLYTQLTDRLIYVPVEDMQDTGGTSKIQVIKLHEGEAVFVPVFTSEARLEKWSQAHPGGVDSISLFAGDLCAVLEQGVGMHIDPESERPVRLGPESILRITELVQKEVEAEAAAAEEPMPAAPPQAGDRTSMRFDLNDDDSQATRSFSALGSIDKIEELGRQDSSGKIKIQSEEVSDTMALTPEIIEEAMAKPSVVPEKQDNATTEKKASFFGFLRGKKK